MLIASLRDVIRNQAAEIEKLQSQLKTLSTASSEVRLVSSCCPRTMTFDAHILEQQEALRAQVASLIEQLQSSDERKREVEKEQEDLLVLLDELNSKRRKDKERMRSAGMDVSEDEADDATATPGESAASGEPESLRQVPRDEAEAYAQEAGLLFFETSAKTGDGVVESSPR